jgi:hypothetical protein
MQRHFVSAMVGVTVISAGVASRGQTVSGTDVKKLADANVSTFKLIYAIDLKLERFIESPRDTPTRKGRLHSSWRWSMQGEQERIRYRHSDVQPDSRGLPTNLGDMLIDNRMRKILLNWTPESPQSLAPLEQGTVDAYVEPRTPESPAWFADPASFLCLRLCLSAADRPRLLTDLVRESPRVLFKGKELIGNHETLRIYLEHPGIRGKRVPGNDFEVFLDPSANFLIRRLICHQTMTVAKERDTERVTTIDVITFKDCGHGVFVPTEIEERFTDPRLKDDVPLYVMRERVSDLTVNQELPEDALNFRFPKYAQVRFFPPVRGRVKAQLWGDDDKPILDIDSPRDLLKFAATTPSSTSWSVSWFEWTLIACALVVIAFMSFTRWRRHRRVVAT